MDASPVFELAEHVLDLVTLAIELLVIGVLDLAIGCDLTPSLD